MRLPGRSSSDPDHSIGLPAVAFRVDVYTGRERVKMLGPFSTEHDALMWCHEAGIEIAVDVRDGHERRAIIRPVQPPRVVVPVSRPKT
jgi:hypothetical protein